MPGHHFRREIIAHAQRGDDRVEEYGRLRHFGLLQVLVRAVEHDVRDTEAQDFVCFLKQIFCQRIIVIQVFAHAYELCSLTGKNKCFHNV